ncbi:hypothetical protein [Pseudomonas sp. MYb118]|uniref:hypothetical protein n=1 Tax=Pseudomonas sp. MYb118 TaxID=1848720 RepID=UPI0034CE463D
MNTTEEHFEVGDTLTIRTHSGETIEGALYSKDRAMKAWIIETEASGYEAVSLNDIDTVTPRARKLT